MKAFCSLFLISICSILNLQSQTDKYYKFYMDSGRMEFGLTICSDNSYLIELSEQLSPDIIQEHLVSIGHCKYENEKIILIDKILNYKMELVVKVKNLVVKKSFSCLANNVFYFNSNYPCSDDYSNIIKIDALKLIHERDSFANAKRNLIFIGIGGYTNTLGFDMEILPFNNYKYYYKGLLISEGNWNQSGNILELYDRSIEDTFHVLIKRNELISKLLPFDYSGIKLKKQ